MRTPLPAQPVPPPAARGFTQAIRYGSTSPVTIIIPSPNVTVPR